MSRAGVCWLVGLIGLATFAYGAYIPIKAELAQLLIHRAWDESVETGEQVKPWGWADMHPVLRLQSTQHDQDLIVLSGDTGNVLAFGPGLSGDTPYVAAPTSMMISGHRDTHFDFLKHIEAGDTITITTVGNTKQVFRVSNIEVVDTSNQDLILADNLIELKLVTCFPFDAVMAGGSLRYVVTATL